MPVKLQDYIIELRKPSYLIADLVSRLMLMIAIAFFGYAVIYVGNVNWYTVTMSVLVIGMIAWWIRCTIRINRGEIVFYRFGLLLATIGWVIAYRYGGPLWVPVLYGIVTIAEKQVKFPQEIAFNEEGIVINTFPKKEYAWSALSNVVLKDNILTIDFKNNKLIQKEIESDASPDEEKEFNAFCTTMLNKERATQNA
ncbi:hypothetical protein GWC95_10760 [Sediminibacterium roseum]|uniref:PH domain-containing protein n=1 Tax=Sediminibacterium roseum TaxID=1978412 RepID=A0ABW9ZVZ7_9BACT|nr:hypothetical protein [Sediminibacterium roseum]NCI50404.1 hypothetical protein [Sediminibacterium roseum]